MSDVKRLGFVSGKNRVVVLASDYDAMEPKP